MARELERGYRVAAKEQNYPILLGFRAASA